MTRLLSITLLFITVGCQRQPRVVEVKKFQMPAYMDTNTYYSKLAWEGYTNLCINWLIAGHVIGERGVSLNQSISNATFILEQHRPR